MNKLGRPLCTYMRGILAVFGGVSILLGIILVPMTIGTNAVVKLGIMSKYRDLVTKNIIEEGQLHKVGWETLPGNEAQKPEAYFLGNSMATYETAAWIIGTFCILNGVIMLVAMYFWNGPNRLE